MLCLLFLPACHCCHSCRRLGRRCCVAFSFPFQLAAKEAYLQAKAEIADEDRRRILAEFRTLIQEAATTAAEAATEKVASKTAAAAAALTAAERAVLDASAATGGGDGGHAGEELVASEDAAVEVDR